MKYEEQLRTSEWMARKFEILKRDGFMCWICVADNLECQLQVHHIMYISGKLAWEYPDYMLVTLCADCHKKEHDRDNIHRSQKILDWMVELFAPKWLKETREKSTP